MSRTCCVASPGTRLRSTIPAGTSGENVCATSVFCGSYTITYLTPLMAANWSTVACTVDASRVSSRSTPELARLFAMALPLEVNSSVRFVVRARTEIHQVIVASGTSVTARNRMIFPRRPSRTVRCLFMLSPPPPVRDGGPSSVHHSGEVHVVQPLMPLGPEREGRADAEVEAPQ